MGTSMEHLLPLDASRLLTTSELHLFVVRKMEYIHTKQRFCFGRVSRLAELPGFAEDYLKYFFHCLLSTS